MVDAFSLKKKNFIFFFFLKFVFLNECYIFDFFFKMVPWIKKIDGYKLTESGPSSYIDLETNIMPEIKIDK